jgi:hypothetical protein
MMAMTTKSSINVKPHSRRLAVRRIMWTSRNG